MKRSYRVLTILSVMLSVVSLLLVSALIFQLLQSRGVARAIIADGQMLVTEFSDDTFSYTVELDQSIPISTSIPFSQTVTVPFKAVLPVNTTIVVPLDLGFTTYNLSVPIRTTFPVDLEVTVPFSETVDVSTVVPVELTVPIEIAISDLPLADYLEAVSAMLEETDRHLEQPFRRAD